jgi:hypothetical protein
VGKKDMEHIRRKTRKTERLPLKPTNLKVVGIIYPQHEAFSCVPKISLLGQAPLVLLIHSRDGFFGLPKIGSPTVCSQSRHLQILAAYLHQLERL